ncbi:MAG: hypothetical protein WBJ36_12280, partial [Tenuifilum sp.]|uniref:hypothetical protein n=1 Tax=Tenuifilum sp. TaxID=2760880 RepID=UPI003C957BE7
MTKNTPITEQIRKIALDTLANRPDGIRYSDLKREILKVNSSFNPNTINGAIWDLDATYPDQIYKPDRGVFRLLKFKENVATQPDEQPTTTPQKTSKKKAIKEEDFYQPFAD